MPLTFASWNVNSIRARLDNVTSWLKETQPDVAALQEIKATEANFPFEAIEAAGYHAQIVGQKSYNGVALISKEPIEIEHKVLPGFPGAVEDEQARFIQGLYKGFVIGNLYLPNGNPKLADDGGKHEKFTYKLDWMQRLTQHMAETLPRELPAIFMGDYNVIPEPEDCWDPRVWAGDALFASESRLAFQGMLNLGYTDAFRQLTQGPNHYSFWDYQGGAYPKDHGIRIDHHLMSAQALDRLIDCKIDRAPRALEKASDHTPILVTVQD